jgi:hypothetical protein
MHGKTAGLRTVARVWLSLGGALIEVENPGDHPIPPSYEYELFSNPNPLVAAGRAT